MPWLRSFLYQRGCAHFADQSMPFMRNATCGASAPAPPSFHPRARIAASRRLCRTAPHRAAPSPVGPRRSGHHVNVLGRGIGGEGIVTGGATSRNAFMLADSTALAPSIQHFEWPQSTHLAQPLEDGPCAVSSGLQSTCPDHVNGSVVARPWHYAANSPAPVARSPVSVSSIAVRLITLMICPSMS